MFCNCGDGLVDNSSYCSNCYLDVSDSKDRWKKIAIELLESTAHQGMSGIYNFNFAQRRILEEFNLDGDLLIKENIERKMKEWDGN